MLPCGYDNKKVRVRVKVKLGLGSAKVECTMYSESGLVPSPSLFQNHVLTGVTSFKVYVSDVIGRRFEKVKHGHIFEDADLRVLKKWTFKLRKVIAYFRLLTRSTYCSALYTRIS